MSQTKLGTIEISPRVLEAISGIVVNDVKGVYGMPSNLNSVITQYLTSGEDYGKGVTFTEDNGRRSIDVYVYLKYGYTAPRVAEEIQKRVKSQVLEMTDILLDDVNVYIVDYVLEEDTEAL